MTKSYEREGTKIINTGTKNSDFSMKRERGGNGSDNEDKIVKNIKYAQNMKSGSRQNGTGVKKRGGNIFYVCDCSEYWVSVKKSVGSINSG